VSTSAPKARVSTSAPKAQVPARIAGHEPGTHAGVPVGLFRVLVLWARGKGGRLEGGRVEPLGSVVRHAVDRAVRGAARPALCCGDHGTMRGNAVAVVASLPEVWAGHRAVRHAIRRGLCRGDRLVACGTGRPVGCASALSAAWRGARYAVRGGVRHAVRGGARHAVRGGVRHAVRAGARHAVRGGARHAVRGGPRLGSAHGDRCAAHGPRLPSPGAAADGPSSVSFACSCFGWASGRQRPRATLGFCPRQ
jgi:hypothetical protein